MRFFGTFLSSLLLHLSLVPLWIGSPIPFFYFLYLVYTGLCDFDVASIVYGSLGVGAMAYLNWGRTFAYRPWAVELCYKLNMTAYYRECRLHGALDTMRTERTFYLFHPHGILSVGFVANGVWSREFNLRASAPGAEKETTWRGTAFLIAANLREWSAFFKVFCDLGGRLESATRANIMKLMAAGRNLAIIPGGFEDATRHKRGAERTAMSGRKGFVKYALQHGYALTPIYTFGESETYHTFTGLLPLRLWINRFQIPAVLFFGEPWCPILPRRDTRCLSCVGEPLQLPRIDAPTQAQIDEWHAEYLNALRVTFDRHKAEAGKPDAVLEVY